MNKFKFVADNSHDEGEKGNVGSRVISYKIHSRFNFVFTMTYDHRVLFDSIEGISQRVPGQIDKSAIREKVIEQLKLMFEKLKNHEVIYLRMSRKTRDSFRMYFSYEVSYVPKNLTDDDKAMGTILGCIYGVKIIEDNFLDHGVVLPVVKQEDFKHKFESIFTTV